MDNLGTPLATYRGRGVDLLSPSTILILALSFIVILLPISYGLQRGYYGFTEFGLVAAASWGLPWLAIGLIFSIPLLLWLLIRWRNSRRYVSVFTGGIEIGAGRKMKHHFSWGAISGIHYEGIQTYMLFLPLPARYRLGISPRQGGLVQLDSRIEGLDRVSAQIKGRYYPTVMPAYRSALKVRKSLAFGPVAIDASSVKWDDHKLAWENIEDIRVTSGHLVIKPKDAKSHKFPVYEIPNLEPLLTLINEKTL